MTADDDDPSATTIGVVGLGLLGRGIAACFLGYGMKVVGYARRQATHDEAEDYIDNAIGELVRHAVVNSSAPEQWRERYTPALDYEDLRDCDFIIESVAEDPQVKQEVFDQIEEVVATAAPIATNTSALPISLVQQGRQRPERFLGMHWAEPSYATRFLELVRGEQTWPEVMRRAEALARRVGKDPSIVQKDVPGFIVNRLGYAVYREAIHLAESGVADIETIDRSFRNAIGLWATMCGPFRWMDLTGGPALYAKAMSSVFGDLCNSSELSPLIQKLTDEDARGIVNGRGFYDYQQSDRDAWTRRLHDRVWAVRDLLSQSDPDLTEKESDTCD